MYIKNLKILVLISFGFLIIALGMYFDGKNISNKSSSEVLFPCLLYTSPSPRDP